MPYSTLRQRFSYPENDCQIMSSWERFMAGQDPGTDALRRLIDDSWKRCHGEVDPRRGCAPQHADGDALHDLLAGNEELMTASAKIMASARDFLFETRTVMVLTDASGVVLRVEGDHMLQDPAEQIHLRAGANWSELACGTNAIGTALEIGQPIQIHSAEHYCSEIKRWSCSATVIRDPACGAILGAIDISGLNDSYSRHSLALAITAAGRIENRLAQRETKLRYQLLDHCLERLNTADRDGVIIFDRSGRAIRANDRAATVMTEMAKERAHDGARIRDLILPWKKGRIVPENVPDWIDRDWIEPVKIDGEALGAVLVLPDRNAAVRRAALHSVPRAVTPDAADPFDRFVGEAPAYREAVRRARLLARSPAPVLLLGETGVGKDVFAQALHEAGPRGARPFVAINCGGFSRELLTSELFGYAEGAFTGARRGGMVGKIEAANGGTLFLDEIGEMPLDLQPHLLRVLETGEVYRIGENQPRKVALRLIAATNRNLKAEVQEGRFRADLFYRIAVTTLELPSLRDRALDIPALARSLLDRIAVRYECPVPEIGADVLAILRSHNWPGNIRELRNVLEAALLESDGVRLNLADLPPDLTCLAPLASLVSDGSGSVAFSPLEHAERDTILTAVRRHGGNLTTAARDLGIAKSTLYARLERLDLKNEIARVRG
ncbi:sigma-54-dependent Fis family transcriptional regulator [Novosphingobium naphthalenivorans]|uniref:sigma-54-dependent Fis family transcriptional regulator n=1 Tax=Novosphingobium naphthalenivorans TaxID=273168 RepID=UPI00082CEE11|nr:sigma-54-dependent Fis family transcriptional regulator [Novosphingobium naphthalenivorans]